MAANLGMRSVPKSHDDTATISDHQPCWDCIFETECFVVAKVITTSTTGEHPSISDREEFPLPCPNRCEVESVGYAPLKNMKEHNRKWCEWVHYVFWMAHN